VGSDTDRMTVSVSQSGVLWNNAKRDQDAI